MEWSAWRSLGPLELGLAFAGYQALKYVVLSVVPYLVLRALARRPHIAAARLQPEAADRDAAGRDLRWSLGTFVVEGMTVTALAAAGFFAHAPIYDQIDARGWLYFAVSVGILFMLHDTYFYWTHRLLHLPWWMRRVHRIHHLSRAPSALSAFAFHPVEGLIQFGVLIPAFALLPLHPLAYVIFSIGSHLGNTLGHSGHELFPVRIPFFHRATDHDRHHARMNRNFGLYFPLWDALMGTRD